MRKVCVYVPGLTVMTSPLVALQTASLIVQQGGLAPRPHVEPVLLQDVSSTNTVTAREGAAERTAAATRDKAHDTGQRTGPPEEARRSRGSPAVPRLDSSSIFWKRRSANRSTGVLKVASGTLSLSG